MRLKNLLGLMAIGGAVAYAHKQRGGDLSLNGIKGSLNNLVGNVKNRLGQSGIGQRMGVTGQQGQQGQNVGDVGGVSGVDSSVGGGSFGTDDFGSTSSGYSGDIGGNGTRRY